MKRIYLSVPHVIGLVMATGLLWLTLGFSKIMSQPEQTDLVTTWLEKMGTPRHWIVLPLIFLVLILLSRMQDARWPNSLRHSMIWPILGWFFAVSPTIVDALSGGPSIRPFPLVIQLVAYLGAGLILFKAKEIARRDLFTAGQLG